VVSELAVIYNPEKIALHRLEKAFAKHDATPTFLATDSSSNGATQAREAIGLGLDVIFVAGGDGTLRNVVQGIAGQDIAIGILPLGTGNILARNLKIPIGNLDAAIQKALSGNRYQLDLGVAKAVFSDGSLREFIFTGIAGVGMDAKLMENTQPKLKRRVGWIAYIEGGIRSLPLKFERFDVQIDNQLRTLKSYSLLVGNVGWLPGLISMMPDAQMDDGKLDIAAIGPRKIWNWVDFFSRITWQNLVVRPLALGRRWMDERANVKTLENLSSPRIRIKPHNAAAMQLDGDPVGEIIEVDFSLKNKALTVLI
jgi:diacylglycerol kinase family enzyme